MKNKNNIKNVGINNGFPKRIIKPNFSPINPSSIKPKPPVMIAKSKSNNVVQKGPIHLSPTPKKQGPPLNKPNINVINRDHQNKFVQSNNKKMSFNNVKKKHWIIIGATLTGLIIATTAITIPLSLTNKVTKAPLVNWDENFVRLSISSNDAITSKTSLIAWLNDSNNQATINSWFTNPELINNISFEVKGDGPLSIVPTIALTIGGSNVVNPINNLTINGPIDWNKNHVLEQIALIQGIDSLDSLKTWLNDSNNQPTIASWFSNGENATYSIEVTGTNQVSLIPTINLKPGFVNTIDTPTPIENLSIVAINWNHQAVQATIEQTESITNLNTLNNWLMDNANDAAINAWFTNPGNAQSISVQASGTGPFTLTPSVIPQADTINLSTPVAIESLTITAPINWQQHHVLEQISLIQGIDSVNGLNAWFSSPSNQATIASWFSNGENATYSISAQGTNSISLTPRIQPKPGFINRVNPTTISNLESVAINWDQELVRTTIEQTQSITNLNTLNAWLMDDVNQAIINSWFTNVANAQSISVQASGTGPFTLTPSVIPQAGKINLSTPIAIDDLSISAAIDWNQNEVQASIAAIEEVVDKASLTQWFLNPDNQATINAWFSNHENANISVSITGNGPFSIVPLIQPKPGFINRVEAMLINNFTFSKNVNWISENVDRSMALASTVNNLATLQIWLQSSSNQTTIKNWFSNSQYIESVTISATNGTPVDGRSTFNLTPAITMKAGFSNVAETSALNGVTDGKQQSFTYANKNTFGDEVRKLVIASANSSHLQTLLNTALDNTIKRTELINNVVTSTNKDLIRDVFVTVEPQTPSQATNKWYTINFTFSSFNWITIDETGTHQVDGLFVTDTVTLSESSYVSVPQQQAAIKKLGLNPEQYYNHNAYIIPLTPEISRQLTNDMIAIEDLEQYLTISIQINHRPEQGKNHFSFQLNFPVIIEGIKRAGTVSFTVGAFDIST